MIKQTIAVVGMMTILGASLVGCGKADAQKAEVLQTKIQQTETVDKESTVSDQESEGEMAAGIIADPGVPVGTIQKIEGNKVHLLTGDIIEVFEVKNASDFKEGQWAKIHKDQLVELEKEAFDAEFTTMGERIIKAEGSIKESSTEKIVLTTKNGELSLTFATDEPLKVGQEIALGYVERDEEKVVVQINE